MKKIKNLKCYSSILGCTALLTLSGCGSKDYYLEDTILDGAFIADVDGDDCILKWHESHYLFDEKQFHAHYIDVISGEEITDNPDCDKTIVRQVGEITGEKSLAARMTAEDLQKAIDGELTIEDLMNVLDQKNQENEENQKKK